jgi:hypothetical protein
VDGRVSDRRFNSLSSARVQNHAKEKRNGNQHNERWVVEDDVTLETEQQNHGGEQRND